MMDFMDHCVTALYVYIVSINYHCFSVYAVVLLTDSGRISDHDLNFCLFGHM